MRIPLGEAAQRYGAPYWIIHRGDLQAALAAAIAEQLDISLKLGMRMEDFATHPNGVTVSASGSQRLMERAWPCADRGRRPVVGCRARASDSRNRRVLPAAPRGARSCRRTRCAPEFREPLIHLWLGRDAHLVHYPVKAGAVINIVVITTDSWNAPGWSEPANRVDLLPRFPAARWAPQARALVRRARSLAEMGALRSRGR